MADNDLVLRRLRDADCDVVLTWVGSRDAMIQWAGPRDFTWPLTREQLEWAASHGCREIEITCSRRRTDAHAFYRHLGYEDLCDSAARFKREIARP